MKSPSVGFTFTPISGKDSIKLGEIKAPGMDYNSDLLQYLDPATTKTSKRYTYYSAEMAREESEGDPELYEELLGYVGWWKFGYACTTDENRRDDEVIKVGQGFLGASTFGNEIAFSCSGEAPTQATSIKTGGVKSPMIANYLPVDMLLKDITAPGMDYNSDLLQVLDPATTKTSKRYTYYSAEMALEESEGDPDVYAELLEYVGWWKFGAACTTDDNRRDNEVIKAGQAFLGASTFANDITFNFKSVLDVSAVK